MRISFNEVSKNKTRSLILISFFIVLIGIIGGLIGLFLDSLLLGLIISFIFSIIYTIIAYNQGGNMILKLTGARPVTKQEYPHLYHSIEAIAIAAGIKAPKAYVIDDDAMNAFATGKDPNNAAITVTTGLLKVLNRQELEGVIAHEMAHIKNYDIRFMMLTTVLIGIVSLLSHFLFRVVLFGGNNRNKDGRLFIILLIVSIILLILTPIFSQIIKLAISRKREYMADASAAVFTRYPPGLAGALEKISGDDKKLKAASSSTAHLFISSPYGKKKKSFFKNLFSTHPPIEDRIARLKQM
jgi:heat shock protein HtpX